jgi:type IV secretion system protein VirD4
MNEAAAALVRRRARNLLVFVPLTALTVGAATTQFVAWKLNYHPALGSPVLGHAYWPWRIVEWWQAPWEPQVDNTFALVKFGLILTVCFGAMLALKSGRRQPRPHPTIHGTAGFADEDDIKRSGLLPTGKPGIIVGGWTDRRGGLRYLTDTGQGHAMCLGPTRSGKSAGVLVPTLLSWPHSAIVYDPKGELWQMTAGWRHSEAGGGDATALPIRVNERRRGGGAWSWMLQGWDLPEIVRRRSGLAFVRRRGGLWLIVA